MRSPTSSIHTGRCENFDKHIVLVHATGKSDRRISQTYMSVASSLLQSCMYLRSRLRIGREPGKGQVKVGPSTAVTWY
jgi:hypothetical protein